MSETKAVKKSATANKAEELAKLCEEIAYDRKAENIIRIELKEISSISDYFILCTGMNEPHISAISERIRRDVLERLKIKPISVDGSAKSHWIITDFGSVMVHAMTEETRSLYQIESLWSDAPQIDAIQRLEKEAKKQVSASRKKANG